MRKEAMADLDRAFDQVRIIRRWIVLQFVSWQDDFLRQKMLRDSRRFLQLLAWLCYAQWYHVIVRFESGMPRPRKIKFERTKPFKHVLFQLRKGRRESEKDSEEIPNALWYSCSGSFPILLKWFLLTLRWNLRDSWFEKKTSPLPISKHTVKF